MLLRAAPRTYIPTVVLGSLCVFAPLIEGGTTHLPVLIIRCILLVTITAWCLVSMKAGSLTVHRSRLFPVSAVFLGWAAFSVVRSPYTAASLQWLMSLASYAVLLFLVLHLVGSVGQVRGIVAVILGMGVFEALLGVYQVIGEGQPRATGTFFNPNFLAIYEMAVFAMALGLLCFSQRWEARPWEKPALGVIAVVVFLGFVLAQSRGALLAFLAAVAFVGCYRFGRIFLGVLIVGLLAGALVPNPLQQRILTVGAQDPYAYTRLDIWKSSLQRIVDHPWGVGLGMYKYTSFQYRFPVDDAIVRYGKRAESAHNEYLQMGVELGVVGLAVFLVGVGLLGGEIREALNGRLESWERGLGVGMTGGILGILVHGIVDSVFHQPAVVLLLVLFTGLILVLKRLRAPERDPAWVIPFPYHPGRVALVGTCAVLITLLIVRPAAAWVAYERGETEMRIGQGERAVEWYRLATRVDPGTAGYHDAMALAQVTLYQRSGDPRWLLQAMEEFRVGLDLNPLDGRLAHRLGSLHVLLAERVPSGVQHGALLDQAASYFEQGIQLDPYSPFNYLELAKIRGKQGREVDAESGLRRAIRYEPNFLPARIMLAELALRRGRKDVAAAEFREIVKIRERYKGYPLNALERKYLDVELAGLSKSAAAEAP